MTGAESLWGIKMQNKLKEGKLLFAEGKLEQAEKFFVEILERDPANKEAYNNAGVVAFQKGDMKKAADFFAGCLRIDPFYKDAVLNFSFVLRRLNRLPEFIRYLEKVVEKYPNDSEISRLLKEATRSERFNGGRSGVVIESLEGERISDDYLDWEIKRRLGVLEGTVRGLYLVDVVKRYNLKVQNVAEIGVWKGHTSIVLLKYIPTIQQYHLVDPWENYEAYDESGDRKAGSDLSLARAICEDRLINYSRKLVWHQSCSVNAAKEFRDGSLDMAFIDANHDYNYVKQDIDVWWPKVREGGFLGGHDYHGEDFPGVCKAVNERFGYGGYRLGPDAVWWRFKNA